MRVGLTRPSPLLMNALERASEILDQSLERKVERGAPANQHIVVPRPEPSRVRKPHDFPQPPPHPIALDRIADLLRNREPDPRWAIVRTRAGLQHERRPRGSGTRRGAEKVRPLPQFFHGSGQLARRSGAEALPAARPAGVEHLAAALGRHAAPETVAALAHQFARLVGPLHESVLRLSRAARRSNRPPMRRDLGLPAKY